MNGGQSRKGKPVRTPGRFEVKREKGTFLVALWNQECPLFCLFCDRMPSKSAEDQARNGRYAAIGNGYRVFVWRAAINLKRA